MSRKRGEEYSQDLRDRVLEAAGPIRQVAKRFGVSASYVSKVGSRLRLTGVIGADTGPAVGNWVLWMEIWVRALRDERTREIRQAMDARWRAHIRQVLEDGVAEGVFTCGDPEASAVRLVAVLDGLAVQVSLGDPSVTEDRMVDLWLGAAAEEVGLPRQALQR